MNLNILKQFISNHLKDLIMLFQKIFFIWVRDINSSRDIKEWNTVPRKILKQEFNKIHQIQTQSSKL